MAWRAVPGGWAFSAGTDPATWYTRPLGIRRYRGGKVSDGAVFTGKADLDTATGHRMSGRGRRSDGVSSPTM